MHVLCSSSDVPCTSGDVTPSHGVCCSIPFTNMSVRADTSRIAIQLLNDNTESVKAQIFNNDTEMVISKM